MLLSRTVVAIRFRSILLAVCVVGCGPSHEPLTATSEPLPIVSDCPHSMPEPNYHVYSCAGFAVGVSDEPDDGQAVDVAADLRALQAGFEAGLRSQRDKHDARIVVRPIAAIAQREVRGVSVAAVDPQTGETYSTNHAVIVGHRSIVCSTSLDMGREKCMQVLEAFVATAP
jgi:hypothetical protein